MPPEVPSPPPQFQTVSDTHEPSGPLVLKVVPPTWVMFGLSAGKRIGWPWGKAHLSPTALKNDCPWAAICRNICSAVGSGPPPPHEQLSWWTRLSLAMRLKMSTQKPGHI